MLTGVSGSGTSSLAMGVLYGEGVRRYLEALSAYTRRRIGQVGKPEADRWPGIGAVRFKVWDARYEASVAPLRDTMSDKDFDTAWARGRRCPPARRSPTRRRARPASVIPRGCPQTRRRHRPR
jgi:hypothetical protein